MARKTTESTDGVRLAEAYQDLTRVAFAVWVRLSIEPEGVLEQTGVRGLAALLGYSCREAFQGVLRQLHTKGYLRLQSPQRIGDPTLVSISKRPLLIGRDHFIKLS